MNLELGQCRRAVILSAGAVGHSLMMRSDETGTLARPNTLRHSARHASLGLP